MAARQDGGDQRMNDTSLAPSFFRKICEHHYAPTHATIGPWSTEAQHGGPPSALLAHALRTFPASGNFMVSRITIEILGPVPVSPCEIRVEQVRGGKRIELLKAQYFSQGKLCMIAHAWRLEMVEGAVVPVREPFVLPTLPGPQPQEFFPGITYFPYGHALEWRCVQGGFTSMGPATVWARSRIPLVEGLEIDPLESLMLMIDSANGVSAELDIMKWTFVPVDLTVGLFRQPVGAWVGMTAHTTLEGQGIGQTNTVAFDATGSLGRSLQTVFVRPR